MNIVLWVLASVVLLAVGALGVIVACYVLLFFALRSNIPQTRCDTPDR